MIKRYAVLALLCVVAAGTVIFVQRRQPHAGVSADALVSVIAGSEREISRLPALGTHVSDEEEIAIGDRLAARAQQGFRAPEGDDAAMQAYIEQVGAKLAAHAHRKLPYRFHYVPEREFVNAFALPGGHVFIGGGLVALMDNEDELADILGHEIEHIDHYHCIERVQMEAGMRNLGLPGLIAGLPLEIFMQGYSKEQELEADSEGTRLGVAAGYSPYGAITMFQRMARLRPAAERTPRSPQGEVLSVTFGTLAGYFRSHPLEQERIANLERLIRSQGWQDRKQQKPLQVRRSAIATEVPKSQIN